jgi:hypothetical protein
VTTVIDLGLKVIHDKDYWSFEIKSLNALLSMLNPGQRRKNRLDNVQLLF